MIFERHHKDRRLEWWLAGGTFGFGVWLADGSRSMDSLAYDTLRRWMLESDWAILFILTGALHLVSLGINGSAWWTPFTRTFVTAVNSLVFAAFATGFAIVDISSTGVYMYSILSVAALICIYSAVRDACNVWGSWRYGPE